MQSIDTTAGPETDPPAFWNAQVDRIDWISRPAQIDTSNFASGDIRWFEDGVLNACYNCVDRHLADRADRTALIWEGDRPGQSEEISYRELHARVVTMANRFRRLGVERGHRVTLYLPMTVDAAVAMLACARIGAVHSVVFAGFSATALRDRIVSSGSRLVVTADVGRRGGRDLPLKAIVDTATADVDCPVLVMRQAGAPVEMRAGRDHWADDIDPSGDCPCEPMAAEDPLFILYTSGSTGAPKGLVHTTGGYLVWAATTFQTVFDPRPDDVFWCTADIGWITGHSYVVYGPLASGTTSLLFEGIPTWPEPDRWWEICARRGVSIFYTAPTAIRTLMQFGADPIARHDLSALRLLGTVGEPISPDAWEWYHAAVGGGRCPIVDTWWQTETGGILITTLPGRRSGKPGAAGQPLPGIVASLVAPDGAEIDVPGAGALCISQSWPGLARTIDGDHQRFVETYFTAYPGRYFSGDGARRDADGYIWITGRVDDVINVSGHRIGTAEVEAALTADDAVPEAAVVGIAHPLKGQALLCYVVAADDAAPDLPDRLRDRVRATIGAIATPELIVLTPALPKTRSGKIMRRILRKIGEGEHDQLGDTSTLIDPSIVDLLITEHGRAQSAKALDRPMQV